MIPNFILSVSEDGPEAVYETSYVSDPATGVSFLKFNKDQTTNMEFKKLKNENYQRMTSGVWMMPDTKYLRVDKQGNYYTVQFTQDTLFKALMKYLKEGYADAVKVEHDGQYLDGFVSIEHWVIKDENTLSPVFGLSLTDLGYNPSEIPVGTVMKTTYVSDEAFWNEQVLTGNVTGYSIGGLFNLDELSFNAEVKPAAELVDVNPTDLQEGDNIVEDKVVTVQDGVIVDVSPVTEEFTCTNPEHDKEDEQNMSEDSDIDNMNGDSDTKDSMESEGEEKHVSVSGDESVMEQLKAVMERLAVLEQENNMLKDQFTQKEKVEKELRSRLMNQPMTEKSNFAVVDTGSNKFKTIMVSGRPVEIRKF